jgi:hypothetical protein
MPFIRENLNSYIAVKTGVFFEIQRSKEAPGRNFRGNQH